MLKIKTHLKCRIKVERINVLRKQYDAFLEEDKKRKDRNDYILGRLDKMRYNSTAVQLRSAPSMYRDHIAPSYDCDNNRSENLHRNNNMQMVHLNQHVTRPSYQNMQLDVPRNVDETSILKEISRKYILIPKLRSTFATDVCEATISTPILQPISASVSSEKPSDIDNSDWKSKYDILEQLKMKEREEVDVANKDVHIDRKESSPKNNLDRARDNDHVTQNSIRDELPIRYEEEIPEKDISGDFVVENELNILEKCTINDNINHLTSADDTQITSNIPLNSENSTPYDQIENKVYDQYTPEISSATAQDPFEYNTQPEQYVVPAEQIVKATSHSENDKYEQNYPEQEFQPQEEQPYPIEYEQFVPNSKSNINQIGNEKIINEAENDFNPQEEINPSDEINKDIRTKEAIVSESAYTNEIAETKEFTPGELTLQDGQNITPENYTTEDATLVEGNQMPQVSNDDPIDNSGIEEFDAEQREMFYSEQGNENYAYDNQGAAEGAYDAEYSQNQNYQAQDYAYYEGAQQEGDYPAEINEHEETQQLYDQNYEQQYANANYEKGYEQQAVYMEQDPNQQQYEQPVHYEQGQQEFEQYNLHPQPTESQEQVEAGLDQVDGYIAKQEDHLAQAQNNTAELNVPQKT